MHVLMLPSWYPAATHDFHGSFFREQAEAIVEAGHNVGVLAVKSVSVTDRMAPRALRPQMFHAVNERGVIVARSIALRPFPLLHKANALAISAHWERQFRRYVEEFGTPDVLHAHAMNPGGIAAAKISKKFGIPFVVTEHRAETSFEELRSRGLAKELRRAANDASALIAVSPAFADALSAEYKRSWGAIPNLLPRQFEDASLERPVRDHFVFGHVSNLDPVKRVPLLLEAFAEAFDNDPSVKLRIAGDSQHRGELEALVSGLGLKHVEFVGGVSRAEIVPEFSGLDALVMPSAAESFGVVLWEAMACGVPILATRTDGGCFAVSEQTGLLVNVDDRADLVARLIRMREIASRFDAGLLRARSLDVCGFESFVRSYSEVYQAAKEV